MNLAQITLAGRVGKDPETRKAGEKSIVSFSLAVDKIRRRAENQKKETMWFTVEVWGENRQSENVLAYVKKGNEIVVIGRFETNTYTNSNGQDKTDLVVSLSEFQLTTRENNGISPKDAAPTTTTNSPSDTKTTTSAVSPQSAASSSKDMLEDDEIPF